MRKSTDLIRLPVSLYTAAQVKELDRLAIDKFGVAGFELMRRAASVVVNSILQAWPHLRRVIVVAGTGNNGGDGYLVAALAADHGLAVRVIEAADRTSVIGDALLAREQAEERAIACLPFTEFAVVLAEGSLSDTVVVDALLGIGFKGPLHAGYKEVIDTLNNSGLPVVSIDLPSGLCADTGVVREVAVRADITVCFIGLKQGLLTADGPDYAGRIVFHDLELPEALMQSESAPVPSATRIDINSVSGLLSKRRPSMHKGDCGNVLVVGGDVGYGGAAMMSAEAATRAGAGTVSLLTRSANVAAALARRPEIMVRGLDEPDNETVADMVARSQAIVIGPGLGRTHWSRTLLRMIMQCAADRIPLIVDADALNLLAEKMADLKDPDRRSESTPLRRRENWIMTPHPGEAARLLGVSVEQIQVDRFAALRELQTTYGGVCLLKGAGSLLCFNDASGHNIELCTEGNPGMASGGMGDVLSGLIAAFVAQGLSLADSLRAAVCVHGESADLAAAANGERGLLATDLFPFVRQLVNPGQQIP